MLFNREKESHSFLQRLSNLHPSLKFTMEAEKDLKLPFLDVLVERRRRYFSTTVYRKPTFSGEYIHWHSFAPVKRKTNIISCLVTRALRICSASMIDKEMDNIFKIFVNLCYPEHVVRRTIDRVLSKSKEAAVNSGPKKCPVYLRLPYLGPVMSRFHSNLKTAVEKVYFSTSLRIVYQTRNLTSGIVKDSLPAYDRSSVIYMFRCACNKQYIGRTGRRFHIRRDEHVPPPLREFIDGQTIPVPETISSAIAEHLWSNPHCARQYQDVMFSFLAYGRNKLQLKILEALFIQTNHPVLCKQKANLYTSKLFKLLL